ncbi:plasma-membrane proton-efflux P-type ATPase [Methanobacterium paludis]|uniref:Plasma-membrane proton-efflux P-type ATPase n=1 Tax=Methanobacterium paludis (strain DSM 25820 / JCM 18151 / SWAN1) TaxID=868131 RepID=F6D584_METPW|nr:plasma-membrane proton-efflux P-type ATPase [Methanobacterium paludis]AEG18192.1 plasma-membrane proton-efflux P-type ATPase [Methanobacterium paludis]
MDQKIKVEEAVNIKTSELLETLSSDLKGLSSEEARKRLQKYGYNEISEEKISPIKKLLKFFWGPIPWMIETALILSILIQHWADFTVILILLLINGLVGFWQEYKADNAIDLLKEKLAYRARVLRDGKWDVIPSRLLVPGDIVKIRLGDIVPADLKLTEGDYVNVDESSITGESLPVDKTVESICYSGSVIQGGEMKGLVLETGMDTFFGRAAGLVTKSKTKSHLEEAVIKIGDYLIILDAILVSFIFIAGLFRNQSFFEILGFSLVLTIASIPVAQPAVLSVTMTVGAMALAKKKAIVSKLSAIEEMAGMDVLCSDKTGTLTKNKVKIAEIAPFGKFTMDDVLFFAALASSKEASDAIDEAVYAEIKGSKILINRLWEHKLIKFNPFDPIKKSVETEIQYKDEYAFKVSKGAPQVILSLLSRSSSSKENGVDLKDLEKKVNGKVDVFASRGYRALGVAKTDVEGNWSFVGLISLYDPPRKDSKETIAAARSMGIDVKMVTGDHIAIAKEIAKELNLDTNIMLPSSFLNKPDRQAEEIVEDASGFAEVFPEHKYQIVEILQRNDKIVGMTGDGVNDAPALKKADAGIAVFGATDAAKSAADIVFTKPGLSVIINAITESFKIFHRMRSYSIYRVAETIRILIFSAIIILAFNFYPVTALMLVLIALLDDIPVMTIAYDRTEELNRPQKWDMYQVLGMSTFLGLLGVLSSLILFYIGIKVLNLNAGILQSIIFLKLVVAGHLTMFVTRNTGHFWSVMPSGIFFWSVILTDIFATLLVVFGWYLTPIGWELALLVWLYSLTAFLIEDQLKIYFYKVLDSHDLKYFKS